jgi:DNA-binding GntR family transcriptional regulator
MFDMTDAIANAPDRPLHEAIYDALRGRLALGQYAPGACLSLRGLAGELGGSVTPVRDAVGRLAAERALALVGPARRIMVPHLDADTVSDLFDIRALLEPELAARAMAHVGKVDTLVMATANRAMHEALRQGDRKAYMRANHHFHFALYRVAPGAMLLDMVEGLWVRFGPIMRYVFADAVRDLDVSDQHGATLDAIASGDEVGVRRAIRADIDDGKAWAIRALSQPGPQ